MPELDTLQCASLGPHEGHQQAPGLYYSAAGAGESQVAGASAWQHERCDAGWGGGIRPALWVCTLFTVIALPDGE